MGGGGFTSKPENLKLDKYLLSLSDKKILKFVLYLRQVETMRVIKNVFILHIKSLIVKRAIYLYLVHLKVT